MFGADRPLGGQWTVKFEALLAVQNLSPGDSSFRLGDPERRPAQCHTHGGHGALIAAFIDIGEFILVEWIIADAQPERVKRGIAPIPGLAGRLEAARDHMLEVHGGWRSQGAVAGGSLRTRTNFVKQAPGPTASVRQSNARRATVYVCGR